MFFNKTQLKQLKQLKVKDRTFLYEISYRLALLNLYRSLNDIDFKDTEEEYINFKDEEVFNELDSLEYKESIKYKLPNLDKEYEFLVDKKDKPGVYIRFFKDFLEDIKFKIDKHHQEYPNISTLPEVLALILLANGYDNYDLKEEVENLYEDMFRYDEYFKDYLYFLLTPNLPKDVTSDKIKQEYEDLKADFEYDDEDFKVFIEIDYYRYVLNSLVIYDFDYLFPQSTYDDFLKDNKEDYKLILKELSEFKKNVSKNTC